MRSSHFGRLLALGMAIPSFVACSSAGQDNDSAPSSASHESSLINAPIDTAHPFEVGVCTGVLNTDPAKGEVGACVGTASSRCSGSLVAPNLVLTARHCVHQGIEQTPFCNSYLTTNPAKPGGVRVSTDPSIKVGGPRFIEVSRIVVAEGNNGCDDDVALLVLSQNINDVEPAWVDLHRNLVSHPPADGKAAVVGRGVIDRAYDPVTHKLVRNDDGDLKRRVLTNVPFIGAGVGYAIPDFEQPNNELPSTEGIFLIGRSTLSGDSGCGVFLNDNFATKPTLIGVHSAGGFGLDGESSGSLNVRLDRHRAWIVSAALQAAREGNYTAPSWASTVSTCSSAGGTCRKSQCSAGERSDSDLRCGIDAACCVPQ
ncbi:trypsin-like serine protease [Pendulispora albinea]|uniref:Trypsin-like serine protease n=1 Tax=Pendulispora albinea TaxID=2741071 RepID=A0ABZ2M235_9BACT